MAGADPSLSVSCTAQRTVSGKNLSSQLLYVATVDGQGDLTLKYELSTDSTDSAPCSQTTYSKANSGATGTDVLIASYQVSWVHSSNYCDTYNLASANIVERSVIRILANTATTSVTPTTAVMTNTETLEPLPANVFGNSASIYGARMMVSGSNVFMMVGETQSGMQMGPPNFTYKIAVLDGTGSFGDFATMPLVNVAGESEFTFNTNFSQLDDFSEDDATSILVLRTDAGGTDSGTTAARIDVSDGTVISYRQMVATSDATDGFLVAVGDSSGALNFFGIKSRTEAVLGT